MEVKRTLAFKEWIDGLRDLTGRARIQARIERLADGNPGDHRNLSGGVSEMRVDVGAGYRVYYTQRGNTLLILLAEATSRARPHSTMTSGKRRNWPRTCNNQQPPAMDR